MLTRTTLPDVSSYDNGLSVLGARITSIDNVSVVSLGCGEEREATMLELKERSKNWDFPPSMMRVYSSSELLMEFSSPMYIMLRNQTDLFHFVQLFSDYLSTLPIEAELCLETFLFNQKRAFAEADYVDLLSKIIIYDELFDLEDILPRERTSGMLVYTILPEGERPFIGKR